MQNYDKSMKIIITILIVLAIVMLIFAFNISSSLSSISQRIDNITNRVNSLYNTNINYTQIEDIIIQELENETYLSIQPSYNAEYKNGKIALECKFILNEAKSDEKLQIWYKKAAGSDWESTTLKQTSVLNYAAEISLELFSEYEYYIVKEGELSQSSKIVRVPFEYCPATLHFAYAEFGSTGDKVTFAHVFIENYKTQIKGLDFTYRLDLYSGDELIKNIEIQFVETSERIFVNLEEDGVMVDKIIAVGIIDDQEYEKEIYRGNGIEREEEKRD